MRISFVEVLNFRKLKAVRIDFNEKTTLFVGANNSGKTSAMLALGHFLVDPGRFTPNDFTLSNWSAIDAIGKEWETDAASAQPSGPALGTFENVLPTLDLWLDVSTDELHYARALLPTLDWVGGLLGVRLRYAPKDIKELYREYVVAIQAAKETKRAAGSKGEKPKEYSLKLWPDCMRDFLERRLRGTFTVKAYLLDVAKCEAPQAGIAKPQSLPAGSEPLDSNPLQGLVRIDEIAAQRGLGDSGEHRANDDHFGGRVPRERRRLTEQLRSYYSRHLDPSESPEPADLDALEAIENAQKLFDGRLAFGFGAALNELASLNYPGITDPKLTIATRVRPTDGLNHSAAVQYEVISEDGKVIKAPLRLPEEFNGLGYQNLISMVFKLMSFRDAWMRVGKAGLHEQQDAKEPSFPPPLHLVLIEEPEAHLHAQVQQVFVRKAYEVLRNHKQLKDNNQFRTQLIVSTHSSHIAHETLFSCLRYFRRMPASVVGDVPTSAVVNLSQVFGPNDETDKFVSRYLKATHCDLLFADAAILVEGSAERMLVPHFIRRHFPELARCYITLLEIGGSHAHRLRPLIEHLGLTTLIITDLDSVESASAKSVRPKRRVAQRSGNPTLREWHPKKSAIDDLLDIEPESKVLNHVDPKFDVRVAYQTPVQITLPSANEPTEMLATTFEDSLLFENLPLFKDLNGTGLLKQFRDAIAKNSRPDDLANAVFEALRKGDKAAFALDLLALEKEPADLSAPKYISEGLQWLQKQVTRQQEEVLAPVIVDSAPGDNSCPQ